MEEQDKSINKKMIKFPNGDSLDIDRGIVIVGANGSGKTRLGSWIEMKSEHSDNAHRISAQKSLIFPNNIFSGASKAAESAFLYGHQNVNDHNRVSLKEGNRWGGKPDIGMLNDYESLLTYLFSENNEKNQIYKEMSDENTQRVEPPCTKLDKVKMIWEKVITHRKLKIGSGTIEVSERNEDAALYNASLLSDGERVVFYLIGQCLAAPSNCILIIDEPELHLHKSIQYSLWNAIEMERQDCIFIYFTHDIEFAVSRATFKKIWLKSFKNNDWEWEEIRKEVELPEELLLELYGSRKKILLVEGDGASYDTSFYRYIFKDFLVKPCGSCENVINYTKTLKQHSQLSHLEVYGLVDLDRRTLDEVSSLEKIGVFTLKIAEIENIFVTPEILKIVANSLNVLDFEDKLIACKDFIFQELKKEKDTQIMDHTYQQCKHHFSKADYKSKNISELSQKLDRLKDEAMNNHNEIKEKIEEAVASEDYNKLLVIYNRKNIASRMGGRIFGLREFIPQVIRYAQDPNKYMDFKEAIKNYIPESLYALLGK